MKRKIFELYEPTRLPDFLDFKKENPEETFVYVLQHPPRNVNILQASDYGYLVICLQQYSQAVISIAPFIRKMKKCLGQMTNKDYILGLGDPAIIGISTAIASDVTNGQFKFLKWDRQEMCYYPLEVDIYQKGI